MSGQMAALADGYRRALAVYLGEGGGTTRAGHLGRQSLLAATDAGANAAIQKLDALDARRRAAEAEVKPDVLQLP